MILQVMARSARAGSKPQGTISDPAFLPDPSGSDPPRRLPWDDLTHILEEKEGVLSSGKTCCLFLGTARAITVWNWELDSASLCHKLPKFGQAINVY